jgi:hypothetical protein
MSLYFLSYLTYGISDITNEYFDSPTMGDIYRSRTAIKQPLTRRNKRGRGRGRGEIWNCRVWVDTAKDEGWVCKGKAVSELIDV